MQKNLSIIVLTYNSSAIISQCLASFDCSKYDVFVIDNASCDNTIDIVKNNFPTIKIIANDKNIGFGRANNIALRQVSTAYSLILNPDALITDDAIAKTLEILQQNQNVALASPYILQNTNDAITFRPQYNFSNTHFVVGGVVFINMSILQKVGFFDEQFFMFAEDSDLCDRCIVAGYQNIIINSCYAVHIGASSSKKTYRTIYRRFWHLGWSKSKYKQKRKTKFNFIRSTVRLVLLYFSASVVNALIWRWQKVVSKFAYCVGCFCCLLGLKAFDNNNNPRG
jgi:GT2 family glycosyltransferase